MQRINLARLDRFEANEVRRRKLTSQLRAIRRGRHQLRVARQQKAGCR
jgi:hypothetical protein